MSPKGRRLCVLSAPGDRRDEDLVAIARAAAVGQFDHYICRRDDALRGRTEREVPEMLANALRAAGVDDDRITIVVDEQQAIEHALRMARTGDLVLVFADALARGWKQIVNFRPDADASLVPAPRAARAVPRAAVTEEAPADDAAPAKPSLMRDPPESRMTVMSEELVLLRDSRGVILAPDSND
jgi:cyanophycin synthetase